MAGNPYFWLLILRMTIQEEKQCLRRSIKAQTKILPTEEMIRQATEVFARVEELPEFRSAHTIGFFHSLPDEIPTHGVLMRWTAQKRIVLPVVAGSSMMFRCYAPPRSQGPEVQASNTIFASITDRENYSPRIAAGLTIGAFGIAEPAEGLPAPPEEIDLLIVPGVAFDSQGFRLGRGKGFYDKFLVSCPGLHTVGVCLRHQFIEHVPHEPHDLRVDRVLIAKKG